jgi:thioredoxin reductase (NADPH)
MAHSGTAVSGNEELLVVCLCAAWCKACSEFRDTFDRLAQAQPGAHFVWLDVEDDSALIGDIEIENFPTLAVFRGETPLFYGVIMPQEGVVERALAQLSREHGNPVSVPEEIVGLPGTLSSRL